jgi:hypothetical protein
MTAFLVFRLPSVYWHDSHATKVWNIDTLSVLVSFKLGD